jgi:23S rRNA (cytosine1962-C5)-methyltransferase
VRQGILSELTRRLHPASIIERVDPCVRELETLPPLASGLVQGDRTSTTFAMNSVQFHFDALEGQKTGAFLDQRENYAAASAYARGDALDVSCDGHAQWCVHSHLRASLPIGATARECDSRLRSNHVCTQAAGWCTSQP